MSFVGYTAQDSAFRFPLKYCHLNMTEAKNWIFHTFKKEGKTINTTSAIKATYWLLNQKLLFMIFCDLQFVDGTKCLLSYFNGPHKCFSQYIFCNDESTT